MQIDMFATERLLPYARNARTHSQEQVGQIAASIAQFGFTNPILVGDDDVIVAGHGRLLAAKALGLTEVPVIVLAHLNKVQRRALVLADNRIAESAGWDELLVAQELAALQEADFDLDVIGFSADEVDALFIGLEDRTLGIEGFSVLGREGPSASRDQAPPPAAAALSEDQADEVPEPPVDPITQRGDIWQLGAHRLCCGDSTDAAAVALLMQGEQATLMFTSPPYAQQRDYGAAKEKVGEWDKLMQGVFAAGGVAEDAQLLVNLGMVHNDGEWMPYWESWVAWMRSQGWRRFGWYVWDQGPGPPGNWSGRLAPSHEFVFHFNRVSRQANKTVESKHAGEALTGGGLRSVDGVVPKKSHAGQAIQTHRVPDSVFRIMRHKGGIGAAGSHPAVFPVALVEFVLEAFSNPADLVYEPFCGSGTQLVAAERTNRRCFAMELDPVYCDVAVRRWEIATGQTAVKLG
jgi:DNA modification methylase